MLCLCKRQVLDVTNILVISLQSVFIDKQQNCINNYILNVWVRANFEVFKTKPILKPSPLLGPVVLEGYFTG